MVASEYMNHAIFKLWSLKLAPIGDIHPGSRVSAQETPMTIHLAFWQATDVGQQYLQVSQIEQVCVFTHTFHLCVPSSNLISGPYKHIINKKTDGGRWGRERERISAGIQIVWAFHPLGPYVRCVNESHLFPLALQCVL